MKKTLIELMLEAKVEWPKGAEFAAQDGRDKLLFFSTRKPTLRTLDDVWKMDTRGFDLECLDELASDWREYAARAEYEAAQDKAERDRIFGEKVELPESFGKVSIEGKLLQRQTLRDSRHDCELQLNSLNESLGAIEAEIAADLATLGWGEQLTGRARELEITDWLDLRVGDEIVLIGDGWDNQCRKTVHVVNRMHYNDECYPINVVTKGESSWGLHFKFISRPSR